MAVNTRYDFGRFDLAAASPNIEITETYAASVSGVVNISYLAVELVIADTFSSVFSGRIVGVIAVPVAELAAEELDGAVEARADMIVRETAAAELVGDADICCDMGIVEVADMIITGTAAISVILDAGLIAAAEMWGRAEIGNLFLLTEFAGESMWGLADAVHLDVETVQIVLTIPAGSELRIDTENYLVTLDGENVLYAQSGDWPRLERSLQAIDIDAGSGGELTGSVTYTELWL